MDTPYPYPLALTELERFEPSELECHVAGNPSFQYLRSQGWPFRWAERVAGKYFDVKKANENRLYSPDQAVELATHDTEAGPLLPARAGEVFDSFNLSHHLRSLLVLTAKVGRDAKDDRDQKLLRDLCFWIDQPGDPYSQYGFRWERHYKRLMEESARRVWVARVEELQQGQSKVVAILRHRLNDQEMKEVQAILEQEKFGFVSSGKASYEEHVRRDLHFPYLQCLQCSVKLSHTSHNTSHRQCRQQNAFLILDGGDEAETLSLIPRRLRGLTRVVRFTVPRWTFRAPLWNPKEDGAIFPQLLLIGMEELDSSEQEEVYKRVQAWVVKKDKADEQARQKTGNCDAGKGVKNQILLKPRRSRHLNAVALAAPCADSLWSYSRDDGDSLKYLLAPHSVRVSSIHIASQGGSW